MRNKIFKGFGAILLAVILLVAPMTTVLAAQTDVTASAAQGQELVTRGQFAALVNNAFNLQADPGIADFLDVSAEHPFAAEIRSVMSNGFMVGDSAGYFFPDNIISGAEAAVILNNMIGFDGARVQQVQNLGIPYWAVPAASVLLDLTMIDRALIEKAELTMNDASAFISAVSLALLIQPGTPYALQQVERRDNFFSYVNRRFLATGTFPPGGVLASSFGDVGFLVTQQQQQILDEILSNPNHPRGSAYWNIYELHSMFLDNDARIASISLLEPYFDTIRDVESIEDLLEVARRYSNYLSLVPFYSLSFVRDARVDATRWAAIVMEGPLDLGARDFYVDDPALAGIHAAYKAFLATLLSIAGETDDLEERAAAIFAIEQARAARTRPPEAAVDPQAIFVEATWEELLELTSVTNSLTFREEMFELALEMNVYSPSMEYIAFIESLYVEENLQALKDIALIHILSSFLPVLDDAFSGLADDLRIALMGHVGGEALTIEDRARSFVSQMMWRTFSRAYYQRFSSPEFKRDVTEMVEDIRAVMRDMIGELSWMSEETQEAAIEKLDAVRAFIAFPDVPVAELAFDIRARADGGNLIDFMFSAARLGHELSLEQLRGPANIDIWESIVTSTVNAFYSGMDNAIIIPAGILQYPFYSPNASREQNLGGIGAVIAHEFTHAFDTMGSQFDKVGTLRNWWTEEDFASFNELTGHMIATIDQIVFIDTNLNGAFSAGEAIADLGAMEAVLAVAANMPDADLGLVMESWARIWAARMTPELAQFMIFNSPHLPMKLRVNFILAQLAEFYEVFGIVEGDGMYIPEEERLSFWN